MWLPCVATIAKIRMDGKELMFHQMALLPSFNETLYISGTNFSIAGFRIQFRRLPTVFVVQAPTTTLVKLYVKILYFKLSIRSTLVQCRLEEESVVASYTQ